MQALDETGNSSFSHHVGQTARKTRLVRRGERVFNTRRHSLRVYTVVRGEVLILRRGLLVDLVGPGEFLDTRFWPGANAVAWTDCRLVVAKH
jgi:CRP-like cAMP-binding protein